MNKATRLTRISFMFFLISIFSGLINLLITKTPVVTVLTPLPLVSIISFLLFMILLGTDILIWSFKNGLTSPQFVNAACITVCGISFLTIFINSPVLGNDLNSPFSLFLGVTFLIGVATALINGIVRM